MNSTTPKQRTGISSPRTDLRRPRMLSCTKTDTLDSLECATTAATKARTAPRLSVPACVRAARLARRIPRRWGATIAAVNSAATLYAVPCCPFPVSCLAGTVKDPPLFFVAAVASVLSHHHPGQGGRRDDFMRAYNVESYNGCCTNGCVGTCCLMAMGCLPCMLTQEEMIVRETRRRAKSVNMQ